MTRMNENFGDLSDGLFNTIEGRLSFACFDAFENFGVSWLRSWLRRLDFLEQGIYFLFGFVCTETSTGFSTVWTLVDDESGSTMGI